MYYFTVNGALSHFHSDGFTNKFTMPEKQLEQDLPMEKIFRQFQSSKQKQKFKFKHPGILVSKGQLNFVKKKIASKKEPWFSIFKAAKADWLGARLNYLPKPREKIVCGKGSEMINGRQDEVNDARAAYIHALLWYYSKDERHAKVAIKIMNAWSYKLTKGRSGLCGPLQAGWTGSVWPRAAEIIRYNYPGWSQKDIKQFESMLINQYLPYVDGMMYKSHRCYINNWRSIAIEAKLNIAVFTGKKDVFFDAIENWKKQVETTLYLKKDGRLPKHLNICQLSEANRIRHWYNPTKFVDGLAQETCRDLGHVAYSFASFFSVAETCLIQGLDIYKLATERFVKSIELNAAIENGNKTASSLCKTPKPTLNGTLIIGYNHLANRLGIKLPQTKKFLQKRLAHPGFFHYVFEGLTHAQSGNHSSKA